MHRLLDDFFDFGHKAANMAPRNVLKCAFCTFSTLKWRTLKNGHRRLGFGAISRHIERCHPAEYELIYGVPALSTIVQSAKAEVEEGRHQR